MADVKRWSDSLEEVFVDIERTAAFIARLDAVGKDQRVYAAMLQRRLRHLMRHLIRVGIDLVDNLNKWNDELDEAFANKDFLSNDN